MVEKGSFFPLITSLNAYLIKQTCEVNICWTSMQRNSRNDASTKTHFRSTSYDHQITIRGPKDKMFTSFDGKFLQELISTLFLF